VTLTAKPPPNCFGQSWSPSAVECTGGLDPGYINPTNHTNRRDRCDWYQQCASKTAATNLSQQRPGPPPVPQVIPVNRLAQPYQHPQPAVVPVQQGPGRPVQVQPQPYQPYHPQYPIYQQPQHQTTVPYNIAMVPAHQAYYGPPLVPMAHQVPGAQMLAYLSVPEPVTTGGSWLARFAFEILRAILKAAFHQGAHYVDHRSFTKPEEPPQTVVVAPHQ